MPAERLRGRGDSAPGLEVRPIFCGPVTSRTKSFEDYRQSLGRASDKRRHFIHTDNRLPSAHGLNPATYDIHPQTRFPTPRR